MKNIFKLALLALCIMPGVTFGGNIFSGESVSDKTNDDHEEIEYSELNKESYEDFIVNIPQKEGFLINDKKNIEDKKKKKKDKEDTDKEERKINKEENKEKENSNYQRTYLEFKCPGCWNSLSVLFHKQVSFVANCRTCGKLRVTKTSAYLLVNGIPSQYRFITR